MRDNSQILWKGLRTPSPAHQGTLNPTLRTATVKKNQFLWHVIGEIECRIRLACDTLGNHWRSKWGEAQKNWRGKERTWRTREGLSLVSWLWCDETPSSHSYLDSLRVCPSYPDCDVMRFRFHVHILTVWDHGAVAQMDLLSSLFPEVSLSALGQGWKHLQREGASEVCSHQGSQGNQLSVHSRTRLLCFACLGDGLQKSHHAAVWLPCPGPAHWQESSSLEFPWAPVSAINNALGAVSIWPPQPGRMEVGTKRVRGDARSWDVPSWWGPVQAHRADPPGHWKQVRKRGSPGGVPCIECRSAPATSCPITFKTPRSRLHNRMEEAPGNLTKQGFHFSLEACLPCRSIPCQRNYNSESFSMSHFSLKGQTMSKYLRMFKWQHSIQVWP